MSYWHNSLNTHKIQNHTLSHIMGKYSFLKAVNQADNMHQLVAGQPSYQLNQSAAILSLINSPAQLQQHARTLQALAKLKPKNSVACSVSPSSANFSSSQSPSPHSPENANEQEHSQLSETTTIAQNSDNTDNTENEANKVVIINLNYSFFYLIFSFFLIQVRTLFVSGLPMDAKPRELYLLFRAYKVISFFFYFKHCFAFFFPFIINSSSLFVLK